MTSFPASPSTHLSKGERRPLTVMFCDLVGSTELAGRLDPEELRDLIDAYRSACAKVVAQYEGHVAQFLGDGVMAYFGWPNAHEDSAERAVRAALEIVPVVKGVSAANPLAVHIGIASGTVVVGGRAGDRTGDPGLAVGDTPNLASGLQSKAGAGEVFIAASTRRLVGDAFELSDLGELPLKGANKPLPAWRVHAVRETEGRFHAAYGGAALTPMVGREQEIDLLLGEWQLARASQGRVVLIGGDAGIGKSRLAEVLGEKISGDLHTTLRYQCSPIHRHAALYPVISQLEFAAGFARDDTPEQKLGKMERVLAGDEAERAEAAPLIATLLSLPTERYPALGLSPESRKEKTFATLIGQFEALCQRAPLLIVFEDAQWIDPTSQKLLDIVVSRLKTLPALLLLTHRPQYTPRWTDLAHVRTIGLTSLSAALSAELVGNVAKRPLPAEVLQDLIERADGLPLFIEELTKSVLESNLLVDEGDRYTLMKPLPAPAVPERVNAQLIERLDSRGSVRWLAQIGACIGREFPYDLLSEISPQQGQGFDDELEELTNTGLVLKRGTPPDVRYTFKHALVRAAAYESILKTERRHWHVRIAEALEKLFPDRRAKEPEVFAHHLSEAGQFADAIPLWREAGESALARVALQEAVACLEKGLVLLDRLPPEIDRDSFEIALRMPLHSARLRWQGWAAPEVRANAEALLGLVTKDDPPKNQTSLVVALWGMWVNTITQGRVAETTQWAQRLLAEGARTGNIDLQILGHRASLSSHFYLGELKDAVNERERALALYDTRHAGRWMELTGNDVRTAVGIFGSQALWMLGYPDKALAVSDQNIADARRLGHPFDIGWALTWGAYVLDFRCEPERLLEQVREAEPIGRQQSIPVLNKVLVPVGEGLAMLRKGQLDQAITSLRLGVSGWRARGGHLNLPYLKSAIAEAMVRRGDLSAGLDLLDECLEQIERPGWSEQVWMPEVLRLKGWTLMLQGKLADAERELQRSLDVARQQEAKSWELRSATTFARLLSGSGRCEAARALLTPICDWFTEGFDTHDLKEARALLEQLR
jgi:class 3 adenylate cyclase/tetratricopeptide (TPR) repeat protein